jgi:FkbM family methyltransferase
VPKLPKFIRDLRYRLFFGLLLSRRFKLVTLCGPGSICPWTICPDGLNAKSVIYSGGVGSDISFEHELARRFGCKVVLLDPSPTGVKTMALPENKIPQFHYFPVALAGCAGRLDLASPLHGDSWSVKNDSTVKVDVPCTDLLSLMRQNQHDHIDLLKLDIEGSEYEVIDDFLKRRIPVRQVSVEFHHTLIPGIRRSRTIRAIFKLIASGYKLISQEGENYTFIRPTTGTL